MYRQSTLINPCKGFDLVHLFNCRVEGSFQQQVASCKQAGVPVVVSPIWISLAKAPGGVGTMSVLQQAIDGAPPTTVDSLLKKLRNRELVVRLPKGSVNAEGYGAESWPVNRSIIKELLLQVDGLLPNSLLELQAIRHDLQWHGETYEIAHYGVDPGLFLDPDPSAFRKATGIQTPSCCKQAVLNQQKIRPCFAGSTQYRYTDRINWWIQTLARVRRSVQKHQR